MRYRSDEEDSGRWDGFAFRDGDIVISTRSKSGTTWMQMICALLVFQTPELPGKLSAISPWLDWLIHPADEVYARLEAQTHRRFIKTHTPLDGVPIDPRATYIVVARHPLDMAVSLFHQSNNLDRARIAALTGANPPAASASAPAASLEPGAGFAPATGPAGSVHAGRAAGPAPAVSAAIPAPAAPALKESLLRWIDREVAPADAMDSLPGVMWHLSDAWRRAAETDNVLLVHYVDLAADLGAEMRRIADRLRIGVPEKVWPELVDAAGFARMRERADDLAPDPAGVLKDRRVFFRRGGSGAGRELLSDAEFEHYLARAAGLAPPDVLAWLHR